MATLRDLLAIKGRDVVSVQLTETVVGAANLMNKRNIGGVIVYDGDRVVGIFTERDVLRRVVATGLDPAKTPVSRVMSTPVTMCEPDLSVPECAALMTARRLRHLPVGAPDALVGIVTIGDLLAHQVREQETTIEQMNKYIYDIR